MKAKVYFRRAKTQNQLGNIEAAKGDYEKARNACVQGAAKEKSRTFDLGLPPGGFDRMIKQIDAELDKLK